MTEGARGRGVRGEEGETGTWGRKGDRGKGDRVPQERKRRKDLHKGYFQKLIVPELADGTSR